MQKVAEKQSFVLFFAEFLMRQKLCRTHFVSSSWHLVTPSIAPPPPPPLSICTLILTVYAHFIR